MPLPAYRAMTEHLALEQEIGGYEAADEVSEPPMLMDTLPDPMVPVGP